MFGGEAADIVPQREFGDAEAFLHFAEFFDATVRVVGDGGVVFVQGFEIQIPHFAGFAPLRHGQLIAFDVLRGPGSRQLIAGDLVVKPFHMGLVHRCLILP